MRFQPSPFPLDVAHFINSALFFMFFVIYARMAQPNSTVSGAEIQIHRYPMLSHVSDDSIENIKMAMVDRSK